MDPRLIALLLLIGGCATSAEKLARECMLLERDTVVTQTRDMSRMECKR